MTNPTLIDLMMRAKFLRANLFASQLCPQHKCIITAFSISTRPELHGQSLLQGFYKVLWLCLLNGKRLSRGLALLCPV
jgi:hypothetical protein